MDAEQEKRLATALRECEQMMESGTPLDAEFIRKRYPDVAAELSVCLDGLRLLRESHRVDWWLHKATTGVADST
jgi:hypothetical protein